MKNYWLDKKYVCNKCGIPVDWELIQHFDTLAPMTGYNYIPDCARCVVCKKPVCKKCLWGLGMFMFVCEEKCKNIWEERLKRNGVKVK